MRDPDARSGARNRIDYYGKSLSTLAISLQIAAFRMRRSAKMELCRGTAAACVGLSFDVALRRPRTGPAKPSGLGMVSGSHHTAGRATDACQRPDAARFAVGPHRTADGREPWPWSCGT